MNIVHMLAGGDPLKYQDVFQLSWADAFMARRIKLQEYMLTKNLEDRKKRRTELSR